MLSSMAVAYGNNQEFECSYIGNQKEVFEQDQKFVENTIPLKEESIFDVASLTKLFTCVAVLMLIEKRKIKMTDTIAVLDKRFSKLHDVSIYDVLTYRVNLKSPERIAEQHSYNDALKQVFSIFSSKEKPEKLYSDMHALVLKYIVESVTNTGFDDFLRDNIFIPLNMKTTYGNVPTDKLNSCVCYNYEHKIINGKYIIDKNVKHGMPHDPKARILRSQSSIISGHAGIFSTLSDMVKFCQGLLSGKFISYRTLSMIGVNQSGYLKPSGEYQQYMGLICFSKSVVKRFSEVPEWMGQKAFALSGYTGCHLAIDPESGIFEVMLGNRCHNRLSLIHPIEDLTSYNINLDGSGAVIWEDGREVVSSFQYVYNKDEYLHKPVYERLKKIQLIEGGKN